MDGPPPFDYLATRLAVIEAEMRAFRERFEDHINRSDRSHRELGELAAKLDSRADHQDILWNRALAVLAAVVLLANIVGPPIARAIFGTQ